MARHVPIGGAEVVEDETVGVVVAGLTRLLTLVVGDSVSLFPG